MRSDRLNGKKFCDLLYFVASIIIAWVVSTDSKIDLLYVDNYMLLTTKSR